ncbi:MAG: family 43 glycosylhydrolase [Clostridia bacterium]|nr:family 43 glycosylhydrolase [Clostridia bacterium]
MNRLSFFLWLLCSLTLTLGMLSGCTKPDSTTLSSTETKSPSTPPVTTPLEVAVSTEKSTPLYADGSGIDTFENPLLSHRDEDTWEKYGVGDPFVMRYNGRYYLYCSTRDGFVGVQCWISDDLVHWEYTGLCATEELTKTAYAPEVTYYNGAFYMYTSPAGNGHYVLKSDSPTGPFVAVTDNFGLSIDGHVFIDDDGKWYFYSASGNGIMVYRMSAPDKVSKIGQNSGTGMNGWTEGAMVIKYNGRYFITYTGNHVLSKGYRIMYATSVKDPIHFTPAANNPILLSTSDAVNGIGHSSTVLGPDLDSYYIVYHSLLDRMPNRDMRIDRLVFSGARMDVLGPTVTAQTVPALPLIHAHFDTAGALSGFTHQNATLQNGALRLENGMLLSQKTLGSTYTAEFNIMSIASGTAGAYFSYTDADNYAKALFDPQAQTLTVTFVKDGKESASTHKLVKSFSQDIDFTALQTLTVKKEGSKFTFLVNNRTLTSLTFDLAGGKIGYLAEGIASFGYLGGSAYANGSSVRDYYKPIPGTLGAIDGKESLPTEEIDGYFTAKFEEDTLCNYLVKVAKASKYDLAIRYRAESPMTLTVYQNQKALTTLTLPESESYTAFIVRALSLDGGCSAITLSVTEGKGAIDTVTFDYHVPVSAERHDYEGATDPNSYADGSWKLQNGMLVLDGGSASVGKYLYGSPNYGDYTVEADITPMGEINFGILVRAQNPSLGDAGTSAPAGSDFVQGYFIGLSSNGVVLGKQNYNWQTLTSASCTVRSGSTYHLKVTVKGAEITISLDGEELIRYVDPTPYFQGMAGIRGHYSIAAVDNFVITPLED